MAWVLEHQKCCGVVKKSSQGSRKILLQQWVYFYMLIFSCVKCHCRSLLGSLVEFVQFSILIMKKWEGEPISEWVRSPSVFSRTKADLYLLKDFGPVKVKHDVNSRLKSKVSILLWFFFFLSSGILKRWSLWIDKRVGKIFRSTICNSKAVCGLFLLCSSGKRFYRFSRQGQTKQSMLFCAPICPSI